jgi:hypothetical protein
VIDGATDPPLDGKGMTRPARFVHRISAELGVRLASSEDPAGALAGTIAAIAGDDWAGPPFPPSASIGIVRTAGDRLHVLRLGDVSIVGGDRILADRGAVSREQALLRSGPDQWSSIAAFRERWMNQPGGYPAVSLDPAAVRHAETAEWRVATGEVLLLASDGLTRLVDLFGAETYRSLLERAAHDGIASLVERLRELEEAHANDGSRLRVKTHDDATGVLLECLS